MKKILFIRSSTNPGPRVVRMMNFFIKKGHEIAYWGPLRSNDELINETEFERVPLGRHKYFSGSGILAYLKFVLVENLRICIRFFLNKKDFALVHVSDLELALLIIPCCKILNIPIIYNIHDNYSERYGLARFIVEFLALIESIFVKMSKVTLIPAEYRKDPLFKFCHDKVMVVHNFADGIHSEKFDYSFMFDGSLRVVYAGWISPTRGLLDAMQILREISDLGIPVKVELFGWGHPDEVIQICDMAIGFGITCKYRGQVKQKEVLQALRHSHVSFAFYDTKKPINVSTASNKIPEILATDTILVTSKGTKIERSLSANSVGVIFDDNHFEVAKRICEICDSRDVTEDFLEAQRRYFNDHYNLDKRNKVLEQAYRKIF